MATSTDGGTTASLLNTPQAKDDYFWVDEDGVACFDVMANDLGGNAKVLWSIDTTSDDGVTDLISRDVAGTSDCSEMGAQITLTSTGKILYDTRTSAQITALAEGEIAFDQFTYAIRLANGTLSWATVTVEVTGTNDGPDIFVGAGDDAGEIFAETNLPLSTSGTLSVVDPDTSDVVDTSASLVVSGNQGGLSDAALLAMFSITAGANDLEADSGDTNNLSWSFASTPEAFDYLADGESLTLTYTLTSTDGTASDTQDVVITINGTNDGPDIFVGAGDDAGEIFAETNLPLSTSGTLSVVDPDTSDVVDTSASLVVSGNQGGLSDAALLAMFSITAGANDLEADSGDTNNLSWSFASTPEAFDYLADGESLTLTYTLTSTDGTASDTQDVVITINGTNDAAVIGGTLSGEITEDEAPNTVSGTATAADVDNTPNTFVAGGGSTSYGSFTIDGSGNWVYTLNNSLAAVQALTSASPFLTDTFTIESEDGTTEEVEIHIFGADEVVAVTLPPTFNGLDAVNDHDNDLGTGTPSNPLLPGATEGDDTLDGRLTGSGADTINALGGNDTVNAGEGGDNVYGGSGSDTIYGGSGNDNIYGQAGNDFLYGQDNNDQLYGGSGDDYLDGGNNTDSLLNGGSGNDTILGGTNNDTIVGGYGADLLTGGAGDDIFSFFSKLDTNDTITDFRAAGMGNDQLDLSGIDANELLVNDQDFAWGGDDGPIANGLWFTYDSGTNTTTLFGDTDGNVATAEFMVTLQNFSGLGPYSDPLTPPPTTFLDG